MSLPKAPSREQVQQFLWSTPPLEGESREVHLRRLVREVVLACNQTHVAQSLGIEARNIRNALKADTRTTFAQVVRIAEAAGLRFKLEPCPGYSAPSRPQPSASPARDVA